jgi:hypothetical protein
MSSDMQSRLLNLPLELRLNIWEYLLAPKLDEAQWLDNRTASTTVSRSCWIAYPPQPGSSVTSRPHRWDQKSCDCQSRAFSLLDSRERLWPTVLRVNRQVYAEALPALYQRRTFVTDPNRIFSSLHARMHEGWFLIDRFLSTLPEDARLNIHNVRIPMLLSEFEIEGCGKAFYDISDKLPGLKSIELEVTPSAVRQYWRDNTNSMPHCLLNTTPIHSIGLPGSGSSRDQRDWEYWLGPVMAFADANINIIAVDKHDLGPVLFERVKTAIEVRVWKELLPLRMKRDMRKIARMRRTLESLDSRVDTDSVFNLSLLEIHGIDGL